MGNDEYNIPAPYRQGDEIRYWSLVGSMPVRDTMYRSDVWWANHRCATIVYKAKGL